MGGFKVFMNNRNYFENKLKDKEDMFEKHIKNIDKFTIEHGGAVFKTGKEVQAKYTKENMVKKKKIKKIKKKKLMSMKRLEIVTWIIFSRYIRLRDSVKAGAIGNDWVICYSCGKNLEIKDAEAGHYIPRGKSIYKFAEWNVNSQCCRCNRFLHGNLAQYTLNLIKEYGLEFVEEKKKHENDYHKFTREELEQIRRDCALKISKII